jgi:hypothetical protein
MRVEFDAEGRRLFKANRTSEKRHRGHTLIFDALGRVANEVNTAREDSKRLYGYLAKYRYSRRR